MEKETELYLVERIKKLEAEIANKNKDCADTIIARKCFDNEATKTTLNTALEKHFLGNNTDIKRIVKEAEAFEMLVDLIGLEACHWVEKGFYEIASRKTGMSVKVDEDTFKCIYEGIHA